ncbi:T9SS type A sorting domain-containing protein [candidate division KSB1 bacterium]|nr:T9SS type A sorting domain-containing protein [candidate division KSB1 bacterium]
MKQSSTIPALIIFVLMLVLSFGVPVYSQTGYKLELSKGTAVPTDGLFGLPGQEGLVYVKLANPAAVKGLSFTLSAAPDSIDATGVTVLGAAAANFNAHITQTDGIIKVLLLPNDGTQSLAINTAGVDILVLDVTVRENTPGGTTANLTLANVKLANTSNNPITPVTIVNKRFWFGKKMDVVYNGVVDVFDVLRIIDIALERPPLPTEYERWAADSDDDGLITIVDISAAMDEVVNPSSSLMVQNLSKNMEGSVKIDLTALPAHFTGKLDIPVRISNSAPLHGLQMTLDAASEYYSLETPKIAQAARGMNLVSKKVDGKMNLLLCSVEGQAIPVGESTILTIPVTIKKQLGETRAITIEKALAGTAGAVPMQTFYGQTINETVIPESFALYQNHPNPFNMNTMITFDVPNLSNGAVDVKLEIYNTRGQLVKSLVNQEKQAGRYTVTWNGSDDFGRLVSSGVYFYKLTARDIVLTKKLAIMK